MFNKKNLLHTFILVITFFVVFGTGFFVGKNSKVCRTCMPESVDFSLFWDAYDKLHENFIEPDKINEKNIIYGAISGMTKSLGDPYTDFFDPEQAKMFKQDLAGSFEGIGIEVGIKKERITVIAPLKGTPGDRAGLKSGDQIIAINGQNTYNMSIEEAVNIIRGKKGTKVTLTIFREDWKDVKDIEIIRGTIKVDAVKWNLKNDDVAHIQIRQFDQSLSSDFKKIAFEILKSPAKKIILDLRDNPGGYLEVSQDVAGWFLKNGQVVAIQDFGKDRDQKEYKVSGNEAFVDYPIVVMINNGSASASEILAGSLRDNRKINLIGEKSFGKGSVQEAVSLRDGKSFLKITKSKWLVPSGSSISEVGLSPDVKIEMTSEDFESGKDPQLEKALEIIKNLK